MAEQATDTAKRSGGAQRNNQNARKHGWTSRLHPVPLTDIDRAVDVALEVGDIATLRQAYNAYTFRRQRQRGQLLIRAITLLEADALLREIDREALTQEEHTGRNTHG